MKRSFPSPALPCPRSNSGTAQCGSGTANRTDRRTPAGRETQPACARRLVRAGRTPTARNPNPTPRASLANERAALALPHDAQRAGSAGTPQPADRTAPRSLARPRRTTQTTHTTRPRLPGAGRKAGSRRARDNFVMNRTPRSRGHGCGSSCGGGGGFRDGWSRRWTHPTDTNLHLSISPENPFHRPNPSTRPTAPEPSLRFLG